MSHPWHHAMSSARKFGGKSEDYIAIHNWFDLPSKGAYANFRHRALRHHSLGIQQCEEHFGVTLTNSDGKQIPVRLVAEQHVMEDFSGFIPTVQDWLKDIPFQPWMQPNPAYQRELMARIEI